MPTQRNSILIFGNDLHLLETRRDLLLGRSGASVWMLTSLSELPQIPLAASIDLVVLCHSLSMEQCRRALVLVRSRWPHAQSLVLSSGQRSGQDGSSDNVADVTRGPAYLLEAIRKLLTAAHGSDSQAG